MKTIESDPLVIACHPPDVPINFGGYDERETSNEQGVMCELTRYEYVDFTEKRLNGDKVPTFFFAGGSLLIDSEIHDQLKYYFDPIFFIKTKVPTWD